VCLRLLSRPWLIVACSCAVLAQTDLIAVDPFKSIPLPGRGQFAVFHADAPLLAIGVPQGVVTYQLADGQSSTRTACPKGLPTAGAASRDGLRIAVGCEDGSVVVLDWGGQSPAVVLGRAHAKRVASLGFAPNNLELVSGGDDGSAVIWDLAGRRESARFSANPKRPFVFVGYTPNGLSVVAVTKDAQIIERDTKTGRSLRNDSLTDNSAFSASLDASGTLLAIGSEFARINKGAMMRTASPSDFYREDRLLFYDLAQGKIAKQIDGVDGQLTALSISCDSRFLAATRQRAKRTYLSIFDVQRGVEVFSQESFDRAALAGFSPNGKYLAALGVRGELTVLSIDGIRCGTRDDTPTISGARIRILGSKEPLLAVAADVTLAVMDLDSLRLDKDIGRTVAALLRSRIAGAKLRMVAMERMQEIMRQQNFEMSDRTDSLTAVALGKILNAKKMIFGTVSALGTSYHVSVQLVDVETAAIDGIREVLCERCRLEDLPEVVALLRTAIVSTR
jgi:WD40 repeat protein